MAKNIYVPLDAHVAFKETGQKLKAKWGAEGLLTWILFLAACKRELSQGVFTFASDDEAWVKLGARASAFTLDEFFLFTGRMHQTRRERSGHVSYVSCRGWDEWNTAYKRQQNGERQFRVRERKTRKSPQSKRDTSVTLSRPNREQEEKKVNTPTAVGEGALEEPVDLQIVHDNGFHAERLIEAIGSDADERTAGQVRSFVGLLPISVFERIREQLSDGLAGHRGKYAHAELRRELELRDGAVA